MKTNKKHFELFKTECEEWIEKLGLFDWDLLIKHDKKKNGALANLWTDYAKKVATITLYEDWGDNDKPTDENIKKSARHEVLHLLLSRSRGLAQSRFITNDEIVEADEEIINRLLKIL